MRVLALLVMAVGIFSFGAFHAVADVPPPYTPYAIGATLAEGEPFPKIAHVDSNGPAALAGVKLGDKLLALNGRYAKAKVPFYFFARGLRGPKDSVAELILLRGEAEVLVIKVKRTVRS